ncbi:peptidoglycan-binding domain-containing protein [Tepidibacillus fermentans]|uniref:Putative peptidoglycan binding protein n=1 Tax=Tepidibacillus fermentans TaxID=1281767 RepID=A0A4R3K4A1_9BACI|nr:peptidoglycan-binding domain-containing protein [Tepidibacillus fermentans]TCS77598.1 putative peptidoglycan binding protein [Tepidibacillus fermentans]
MYVVDGAGRIYYPSNYTNYLWSGQTLRRGDRNDYVKTLQSWLYKAGFNPGAIDGIYGANTEKAVKEFQKKVGITADGIAGKQTYQALQNYSGTKTPTSQSTSSSIEQKDKVEISREANQLFTVQQKASKSWIDTVTSWVKSTAGWLKKAGEFVLEAAEDGLDFLVLDDIRTLFDPNADNSAKVLSLISLFPAGKVTKAGKIFSLLEKYGKDEIVDTVVGMGKVIKYNDRAVLMEGNVREGWQHILAGHVIGKAGKTLFPKHMGEGEIKNLIMESVEKGRIRTKHPDGTVEYVYNPGKYGISEMITVVSKDGIIRTSYPTKGNSVVTKK